MDTLSRRQAAENAAPINVRPAGQPDPRLVELGHLLQAIDAGDFRGALAVQRRLRALGLSVVALPPRGQGGRRHG